VFSGDDVALIFLQRHVGLEEARRMAEDEVPVWTWRLRWFRPQEKEEWNIWVDIDGEIVGYSHAIEEAAPGAELTSEEALARAEGFLATRGYDLDAWNRVGETRRQRDHRTDHYFTWDRLGSEIEWHPDDPAAGTVRLLVRIQGEEVGSFNRFLHVPEEFERAHTEALSTGSVLALAALVVTALMSLAAIGIAIVRMRKTDLDWKPAISLGVVVGFMSLVFRAMNWPTFKSLYTAEVAWVSYVGMLTIGLVLGAVLYGVVVSFTTAAGTSLAQETFPSSLGGFVEFATGRLLHPSLAAASLRGYGLAFGFIGYLAVFYWFAQRYMGAWLPAEGPYSTIFDLSWPFLAPLTISLVAAVFEEVTYRLFAISFFKRYTKSTIVALVVPAAIWAFAHSTYPVYPVYLRGIELTVGGVIFGFAFLRLGLVTCIIAHFVVDAFLLGAPLLATNNTTYVISGSIVIGLALAPALLSLVPRRRPTSPAAA